MTTNGTEERPLPDGWEWTQMADVTFVQSGAGFPKIYQGKSEGDLPFAKVSDISNAVKNDDAILNKASNYVTNEIAHELRAKVIPVGSTIFAKIGEAVRLNRRAFVGVPCVVDNNVMGLLPEDSILSPRYLFYFMQTIDLYDLSRATTVPSVRKTDVETIDFPLAPFPEQERIVAEIEKQFTRLDQAVASLKRLQSNLARYKASVLKAACEGRLVPQDLNDEPAADLLTRILAERRAQWETQEWQNLIVKAQKRAAQAQRKAQGLPARAKDLQPGEWEAIPEADYARYLPKGDKWKEKYKEPAGVETAVLPDLPEGWVWATPEQLAAPENYSLVIGPFGSNLKVVDYRDSGVPLIFVRNIRSGIFDNSDTKFVTQEKAIELKAHSANSGDILITKMGDPPGDACFYPVTSPMAIITADCIKWTLSKHLPERRFFVHAINSQIVHQQILGITRGVAQLKVSLGRFKTIGIPLPPLAEQERIVAEVERRLSVASATEQTITANNARAERLRQSILGRAFTGQLVSQQVGAV